MADLSGLKRGRARTRLAAAATAAALLITGLGASAASAADQPVPGPSAAAQNEAGTPASGTFGTQAAAADAPVNALYGVNSAGDMYGYAPNGSGGLDSRELVGYGWDIIKHATQVDHNADGSADGVWEINNAGGFYYAAWGEDPISVGTGWGIYNKVFSPGNLAGAAADDLVARDGSGTLWLYLGYGDGRVTARKKIGTGWQIYNRIAGQGDLTGDGRADIVARDGSGTLWLYKGTGSQTAPFAARTKIGTGWNMFNALVSVGDIDLDGTTDLIARDTTGALYLYKGTGSATSPFKPRVKIGTSGWNTYRLLF
ncbi:FG-GAP repeat domain-containing protein [Streptomyces sp. NPDC015127]|uniref:FG-GAP repeat domain-containing protein n=1 Tax=Streptomyces sp. NPDC015127 TaxID=3364939 RepID=UPI0036FA26A2